MHEFHFGLDFLHRIFGSDTDNRDLLELFLQDAQNYGAGRTKAKLVEKGDNIIHAKVTEESSQSDRRYTIEVTVTDYPLKRDYKAYCDSDGKVTEIWHASGVGPKELNVMPNKHATFKEMLSYLKSTLDESKDVAAKGR